MADEPPPKYNELTWRAIHAAGFLWCDGYLCCERGQWTGNPVFLRGADLSTASRRWYNDRYKRVTNEGVLFFPLEIEPHAADPLPKRKAAPVRGRSKAKG